MFKKTSNKKEKIYEYLGEMLRYGKMAMQCAESLEEGDESMGERDDEDYESMYGERGYSMGNRRGVRGTGRYSRF